MQGRRRHHVTGRAWARGPRPVFPPRGADPRHGHWKRRRDGSWLWVPIAAAIGGLIGGALGGVAPPALPPYGYAYGHGYGPHYGYGGAGGVLATGAWPVYAGPPTAAVPQRGALAAAPHAPRGVLVVPRRRSDRGYAARAQLGARLAALCGDPTLRARAIPPTKAAGAAGGAAAAHAARSVVAALDLVTRPGSARSPSDAYAALALPAAPSHRVATRRTQVTLVIAATPGGRAGASTVVTVPLTVRVPAAAFTSESTLRSLTDALRRLHRACAERAGAQTSFETTTVFVAATPYDCRDALTFARVATLRPPGTHSLRPLVVIDAPALASVQAAAPLRLLAALREPDADDAAALAAKMAKLGFCHVDEAKRLRDMGWLPHGELAQLRELGFCHVNEAKRLRELGFCHVDEAKRLRVMGWLPHGELAQLRELGFCHVDEAKQLRDMGWLPCGELAQLRELGFCHVDEAKQLRELGFCHVDEAKQLRELGFCHVDEAKQLRDMGWLPHADLTQLRKLGFCHIDEAKQLRDMGWLPCGDERGDGSSEGVEDAETAARAAGWLPEAEAMLLAGFVPIRLAPAERAAGEPDQAVVVSHADMLSAGWVPLSGVCGDVGLTPSAPTPTPRDSSGDGSSGGGSSGGGSSGGGSSCSDSDLDSGSASGSGAFASRWPTYAAALAAEAARLFPRTPKKGAKKQRQAQTPRPVGRRERGVRVVVVPACHAKVAGAGEADVVARATYEKYLSTKNAGTLALRTARAAQHARVVAWGRHTRSGVALVASRPAAATRGGRRVNLLVLSDGDTDAACDCDGCL